MERWRGGGGRVGRRVHVCNMKRAIMDHEGEGPSMSVIIFINRQLTLSLMFTSTPGVERRCSTQVV